MSYNSALKVQLQREDLPGEEPGCGPEGLPEDWPHSPLLVCPCRGEEKELDFLTDQVPDGSSASKHWLCGLGLATRPL